MWIRELGPFLIALGGLAGVAAVLLVPSQIRKYRGEGHLSEAEAAARLSSAVIAFLEPARQEVKRLQEELSDAHTTVSQLQGRVKELTGEVAQLTTSLSLANAEIKRLKSVA